MRLGIFTIFDVKAAAYLRPFFSQTAGTAVREFSSELANPGSNFSLYPEDFHIVSLGWFEDGTGEFETHMPKIIATAAALIQSGDPETNVEQMAKKGSK